MNAGRILRAAGFDTDALRVRIAPVDPDDINVWPASSLFRRLWRHGTHGVTHGRLVFIDPAVMVGDRRHLARLVIHELIHVRQYRATGYLHFVTSYLREYLKGRIGGLSPDEAYRQISHEREARELTERTLAAIR
ncbi:MAG TPA: DUF4157 domain-containing protein [Acidimicrobiia bacterium]|nr:DUF4157 domain-containing protein [Acidimicrobiia bacterium]